MLCKLVLQPLIKTLYVSSAISAFAVSQTLGAKIEKVNLHNISYTLGMAFHAMVGAIWAVFYAYFFWPTFDWPPVMQGVVFSLGSALLAGLVMIPQMGLMHPLMLRGEMPTPGKFGLMLGWG